MLSLGALIAMMGASLASAQEGAISVQVAGVRSSQGQVGCAPYSKAAGFPLEPAGTVQNWHPASTTGVQCRFEGLPPGNYAVAVSHDLNGNRRTDHNFLGLPREDRRVTNNVRPSLRPPRFSEAMVTLRPREQKVLTVRLGR
jgi:uncharacterized protein (DUF2141 family)